MSSDISESSPLLFGRVDGGPRRISTDFIRCRIVCRAESREGELTFSLVVSSFGDPSDRSSARR